MELEENLNVFLENISFNEINLENEAKYLINFLIDNKDIINFLDNVCLSIENFCDNMEDESILVSNLLEIVDYASKLETTSKEYPYVLYSLSVINSFINNYDNNILKYLNLFGDQTDQIVNLTKKIRKRVNKQEKKSIHLKKK